MASAPPRPVPTRAERARPPRASAGSRDLALRALVRVERDAAYLGPALDAEIEAAGRLPARDRALATELAFGATRRRLALDHALAAACDRPLPKLEDPVLAALRLGAYQLRYLERVPPRAAVHDTVEALKRAGLARAAPFANAVLRYLAREWPRPPDGLIERLCVLESHPRWLVDRWVTRLGLHGAAALCAANNAAPPLCLRANPVRASRDEVLGRIRAARIAAAASPLSPLGVRVRAGGPPSGLPGFAEGHFQVQDDAAQLVALLAGVGSGERVLDVCAAPGAKSCQLAVDGGPDGRVIALDRHPRKLARLPAEAERLGVERRILCMAADATQPLPLPDAAFDAVIVDAPCSGVGTLRRHPELRYRRRAEDLPRLAGLQAALLLRAADHVRPGGVLVYAVCSPEPEEGRDGIAAFLARDARFRRDAAPAGFPIETEEGQSVTWPQIHGSDAFFAARLRRVG